MGEASSDCAAKIAGGKVSEVRIAYRDPAQQQLARGVGNLEWRVTDLVSLGKLLHTVGNAAPSADPLEHPQ